MKKIYLLLALCFIVAIPQVSAFDWTDTDAYWKLDETSGTFADSANSYNLTNTGAVYGGSDNGIIGNATYSNSIGDRLTSSTSPSINGDFTISTWLYRTGTGDVNNDVIIDVGDYTSSDGFGMWIGGTNDVAVNQLTWRVNQNYNHYDASMAIPLNTWAHAVITYDGTNVKMYLDGVLKTTDAHTTDPSVPSDIQFFSRENDAETFVGRIDETGLWSKALSQTDITELYNSGSGLIYDTYGPTITLIYPVNDTIISDVGTNFSVSGNNLSSISANWTNVTYNIWYDNSTVFNSTTVDFTDNETFNQTLIFGGFTNGNYMWNAEACYTNITGSSCISAIANYTFEWRPFEIISQSYNEYVYETDRQRFNITINTLPEVLNVDTKLNYNGTLYSATTSCASGFCNIYSIIDIPLITSGESINRSLFWSITVYDGTGTYTFNTSDETKQQNITRIHLEECAGVYTTTTVNFTAYYETNLTRINPFYIAGTFDTWLGSGAIYRTQSFNKESTSELKLCITPTNKTQYSNAHIDYKFENENITFIPRNYFFQNKTLTNISEEINLFLLEAEDSTSFIIKVQDQKLSPVVDALVYIKKYYPSDGEYRTVQIARTDSNGETIGFYETETVDYKHIIIKNGETLLETAKQKVVGKSVPFTLTFTIGTSLGFPWTSFEDNQNVSINLTFDKDTNIVTMTYIENITGSITSGQLLVIKNSLTNSTTTIMCNKTSTEASVTLTCDLSAYDGTFTAIAYINGGSEKIIEFIITDARDVFGSDGLFLGMMIIMVGGFAMMWNPSAGIVSINAAVIFVNLIGFITVSPIFIFGMISVSVITIILLKT